jgi:hypothetical protein
VRKLPSVAPQSPAINRPLFNHLGIVTSQLFDAFYSNAVPLLCFRHGIKPGAAATAKKTNMWKLQIIGAALSLTIANPNGPHRRAGH